MSTIPTTDTYKQDNKLWTIIDQQRIIIQELQKALNDITIERDGLLQRINSTEEAFSIGPVPPPRSPFRFHHHDNETNLRQVTSKQQDELITRQPHEHMNSKQSADEQAIKIRVKTIIMPSTIFIIYILDKYTNKELWRIEKTYSDFIQLDSSLKSIQSNSYSSYSKLLHDKSIFANICDTSGMIYMVDDISRTSNISFQSTSSNHSTSKKDIRNIIIEEYLLAVIQNCSQHVPVFCSFISTNTPNDNHYGYDKQGYLTKRGKSTEGSRQYFVLCGSELRYFEKSDVHLLSGRIYLAPDTQIGRRTVPPQPSDDKSHTFQYAFIIIEKDIHHILCADSDAEKDEWVKILHSVCICSGRTKNRSILAEHAFTPKDSASSSFSRSNSDSSIHPLPSTYHSSLILSPSSNKNSSPDKPLRHRSSMDDQVISRVDSLYSEIDNKKKKQNNRKSFWSRKFFSVSDKDMIPPSSSNGKVMYPLFGTSIEETIKMSSVSARFDLPVVVYRCIEYLEANKAVDEEGIYRMSGSSVQISQLRQSFCEQGDIDLLNNYYDIHVVAGLLKMWLRELPQNILTADLLDECMAVIVIPDHKQQVNKLSQLVSALPLANYSILRVLMSHLIHVVHNSEKNKMNTRNVAIVFAPTLSIPSAILTLFLTDFRYIFSADADHSRSVDSLLPTLSTSVGIVPPKDKRSNHNSISYRNNIPSSILCLETFIHENTNE
ncbi:hypothetical protein BDB01DRAFT_850496 [Pilobolus umbonatus]|nr:hypothetical protein BDB01DRAFT_850496 [Pilobolus umbonatus]